jgi:hypothetical protein
MSGIQPVTMPNPPKGSNICMWLWCDGVVGYKVLCRQHWHHVHAIRGVAGAHNSRVSELMHPDNALTSTINPLEQTNM